MGYIYKLKPTVVRFIINQKQKFPDMSCRKLAAVVSKKFNIQLSKSSVTSILNKEKLSSPVGRRTKQRINLQGEIEHGGFSILQAIDYQLDISRIAAEVLVSQHPSVSKELLSDIENVIQGLIIFKSIFDLTIESTRCYNNNEIWTLVGRRPTRATYNRIFNMMQSSQLFAEDLVRELKTQLIPISGFRFQLRDNSNFFVDAQLQSIWKMPLKRGIFTTTYYRAMSYINKFISGENILPIFNVQGTNIYSSEVLDFISALNAQNISKRIKQVELLDSDSNVIETRSISDSEKRFFLLGFWPWQLEAISEFERRPAKKRLSWRDCGVEYYYQIEEISLSQHLVAQELKYITIILKSSSVGAVRMGILTNIPQDIIHNYLSLRELYHWIAPEDRYKEFIKKTKESAAEHPAFLPDSIDSLKEIDKENYLDNIFEMLNQIIFYQFQNRFLPESCSSWSPLKLKDVFLRQKAIIERSREFIIHNILISNELCKEADLKYICQRLNEPGLRDSHDRFLWFTLTPNPS